MGSGTRARQIETIQIQMKGMKGQRKQERSLVMKQR